MWGGRLPRCAQLLWLRGADALGHRGGRWRARAATMEQPPPRVRLLWFRHTEALVPRGEGCAGGGRVTRSPAAHTWYWRFPQQLHAGVAWFERYIQSRKYVTTTTKRQDTQALDNPVRPEFVATNEVGVVLPEDVVVDERADVQRAETLVREAVGVFEVHSNATEQRECPSGNALVTIKYAHRQSAEAELNWVEGPGRAAAETEERDCEEGPEDECTEYGGSRGVKVINERFTLRDLVRGERRRGRRSKRAESDDSRVIYTRERSTASVVVVVKGQESSVVVEGGELRMTIHEWFTLVNGRRRRWWWSKVKSRWWWSKAEDRLKGAESDDSRVVYTRKRSTAAVVAEGQESSVVVEGGELRMTIQTRVSAPPQKRIVEAGGKEGSARGGNGSGTSERGLGAGGSLTKNTTACAAALASQRVVRGGGRRGRGCCVAAADVCVGRGSSVRKAETAQQDLGGRAPWSTSDLHPLTLLATKGQVAVGGFVGKRWRGTVFTTVNSLALASYAVNERSTVADPLLVVLSRWLQRAVYTRWPWSSLTNTATSGLHSWPWSSPATTTTSDLRSLLAEEEQTGHNRVTKVTPLAKFRVENCEYSSHFGKLSLKDKSRNIASFKV
ncbi:hypothetical protein K438DRAFT_1782208 [Mycena galopus ATCC 62051]|nr:hypothetical protein K438DRAFT_1782208 [Mycena galopus ATCC 62051]